VISSHGHQSYTIMAAHSASQPAGILSPWFAHYAFYPLRRASHPTRNGSKIYKEVTYVLIDGRDIACHCPYMRTSTIARSNNGVITGQLRMCTAITMVFIILNSSHLIPDIDTSTFKTRDTCRLITHTLYPKHLRSDLEPSRISATT